jgi:preprotein translocase SecE subunit
MANPIFAIRDYIKHSIAELKKVTWPNRDVTMRFSVLVIVVSVLFAGFFATLDYGLQKVVDAVFIPRAEAPQPVDVDVEPTLLDSEGNPIEVDMQDGSNDQGFEVEGEPSAQVITDDGTTVDAELVLPSLE